MHISLFFLNLDLIQTFNFLVVNDLCTNVDSSLFYHADMYMTEFKKRGLPHAHLLLFLHLTDKYPTPHDINKIISAN